MKMPVLMFAATFLGSIPVMAVVTHQRDKKMDPNFAAAVPNSHSMILYDTDGDRVAFCERDPQTALLTGCQLEPGSTFDDVMNAWLRAYEGR